MGASTTALFYVSLKIAKDEESHLTRAFFHSFKENFRQSTIIWLILLAAGLVLGVDGYVFYHMRFEFDNTIKAMFKNALMIGMRFLFCTALMALIYFIMAVIVIRFFTPAIIFGEGLCALLCSYLLSNILLLCEEKTEKIPEEVSSAPESFEPKDQKWSMKDVHGKAKIGYIWEYYKLPIVIICIGLYIIGYLVYGRLTHKDTVLYTALVNVSANDTFTEELSVDFLDYLGANTRKEEVELYDGLYLTEDESDADYGYVYASNTKITVAITIGQLDVVLMDKKAFDIFSKNGYLCNMEQLLMQEDPDLYEKLQAGLVTNTVIIEDNSIDAQLDPSVTYTAVTDEYPMAVDISQSDLISKEGFNGTLYLGIISNTSRMDTAITYLRYLTDSSQLLPTKTEVR